MEWLASIRAAIDYMEKYLEDSISAQDVADQVYLSPFFLQRGFLLMTGCGIVEYIRNRRLYQAALDLRETEYRVIDIALRYCYETPESFTKAFSRFHGVTPSQVRDGAAVKVFLPLTIRLSVQGGSKMDFKIVPMFPFKVIGFQKVFDNETAYAEIPKFWNEICDRYACSIYAGNAPATPYEQAFADNCIGPIPQALQSVNTRIFSEWLPGNPDYELSGNATVEWYDCINGEMKDPDYHSAIWVPVKKKA